MRTGSRANAPDTSRRSRTSRPRRRATLRAESLASFGRGDLAESTVIAPKHLLKRCILGGHPFGFFGERPGNTNLDLLKNPRKK